MKNLNDVLKKYVDLSGKNSKITLGSKKETKAYLIEELRKVRNQSNNIFWVCVFISILIFIGSAFIIYYYINKDQLDKLNTIFTSSGISLSVLLWYMHKLWKEKVSTDIIIVLSSTVKEDELGIILDKLIKKI